MSLTLKAEQQLQSAGLIEFFDGDAAPWTTLAQETHTFVSQHFPGGATIRCDDVAAALIPLLEVHESLGNCLKEKKLIQKYWIRHFADLILDRTWDTINGQ